jgi:hypothetical protein
MIKIPNPRNETLQQLLPRVQEQYPGATIKKVFLSPEAIFIPYNNFKFVVRRKNDVYKIDHTLPVLYAIGAVVVSMVLVSIVMSLIYGQFVWGIGGALWIVLGIVIMKYLFQTIKKDEFEQFKTRFTTMADGFDFEKQPVGSSSSA